MKMKEILLFLFCFKILQVLCNHYINDYNIEEFDSAIVQETLKSDSSCNDSSLLKQFLEKSNFYKNNGDKNSIITCKDDYIFKVELNVVNNNVIDFSSFPMLEELKILHITGNAFKDNIIPENFFNLPSLEYLVISSPINKIPTNINEESSIRILNLNKCALTEFPYQLKKLKNLEKLFLNENNISGSLTNEIKEFTDLYHLELKANKLEGELIIPDNLNNIFVDGNNFTTYSKDNNNDELNKFSGSYNQFDNSLLVELTKLKSLESINVRFNKLITEIPLEIKKLKYLEILNVQATGIKKLPYNLFKLRRLRFLDISRNPQLDAKVIKLKNDRSIENCNFYGTNILCYEEDACDEIFGINSDDKNSNYKICTEKDIEDIKRNMDNDNDDDDDELMDSKQKSFAIKYFSNNNYILIIYIILITVLYLL